MSTVNDPCRTYGHDWLATGRDLVTCRRCLHILDLAELGHDPATVGDCHCPYDECEPGCEWNESRKGSRTASLTTGEPLDTVRLVLAANAERGWSSSAGVLQAVECWLGVCESWKGE